MIQIKLLSILLFTTNVFFATGIHNYVVPKLEGGSQQLSAYQGKKILIVTLPLVQDASTDSTLYSLDTLGSANISSLKIVAVPSFEDGYTGSQKNQLLQWYRTKLGNHILITEGLYTRKASGTQQHTLFKWLTSATLNEGFDIDVEGPGYKFFANGNGALYSVLRPHSKISGQSVQRTLKLQ